VNREELYKRFELFAEAPNAVAKMRELVLRLAVTGLLVEQDSRDEPADKLVAEIRSKLTRTPPGERGRPPKDLAPASVDENPYPLPVGWVWERLGNLGDTNIGLTYSPSDVKQSGIPVLRSNNIRNGKIDLSDLVRVGVEPKRAALVEVGDLLICARNGSRALVGKAALIESLAERTAFGAFMAIYRSPLNRYLYHFICSPLFRELLDDVNTTTINQLTQSHLRDTLAPIPPFAEQERIVTKVNEMMTLCNQLEDEEDQARASCAKLNEVLLNRLVNASEPDEFDERWNRIVDNFNLLYDNVENVQKLKQSILELGIRGKLVGQDPAEEPGCLLLHKILEERREVWVSSEAVRRACKGRSTSRSSFEDRYEPPILRVDDPPFEVPSNWTWTSFSALVGDSFYGPRFSKEDYSAAGIPTIRTTDMDDAGRIRLRSPPLVNIDVISQRDLLLVHGDLLVTRSGSVGKCALYDEAVGPALPSAYLIRFRLTGQSIDLGYVLLFLLSDTGKRLLGLGTNTMAQPNINARSICALPFPLPPLAEQRRITQRVEFLTGLCDGLESKIAQTLNSSEALTGHLMKVETLVDRLRT
jgi:type I restriction enzyme S subunit